ncbi:MAG: hypothetical protein HQ548_04095 [Chloroflexi bacterium]|nr:hypothetical protein [Chloroflexota bacterium]
MPDVFRYVREDYATLKAEYRGPRPGTSFPTPTPLQFLVMLRNPREMYRAARKAPQAAARDNARDTDARWAGRSRAVAARLLAARSEDAC